MSQRIIDRSYVGEVLQRIYASRMTGAVTLSLTDGYFHTEYAQRKISLRGTTIEEAVTDLAQHVAHEFPGSAFASWWRETFLQDDQSA